MNRKEFSSIQTSQELVLRMDNLNYESYDYYDGLLSPISNLLNTSFQRRLFVQINKRFPYYLRPVLGIPKTRMCVNLAAALKTISLSGKLEMSSTVDELAEQILSAQKSDGGWGYEFDADLRWGSYSANSSNLIATYFCVNALTLAGVKGSWASNVRSYLERQNEGRYFRYAANNKALIHNANLLAAVSLDLVGGSRTMIKQALDTTLSYQQDDGAWAYGESDSLSWIDNFHTTYVLEAILELSRSGFNVGGHLEKGMAFWRDKLWIQDSPKYFSTDIKATKDINTYANVLQLMSRYHQKERESLFSTEEALQLRTSLLQLINSDKQLHHSIRWKLAPAATALAYSEITFGSQR
jgi:prenyltransferase beta subunit